MYDCIITQVKALLSDHNFPRRKGLGKTCSSSLIFQSFPFSLSFDSLAYSSISSGYLSEVFSIFQKVLERELMTMVRRFIKLKIGSFYNHNSINHQYVFSDIEIIYKLRRFQECPIVSIILRLHTPSRSAFSRRLPNCIYVLPPDRNDWDPI
jgi:hypothetical protein